MADKITKLQNNQTEVDRASLKYVPKKDIYLQKKDKNCWWIKASIKKGCTFLEIILMT